MATTTAAALPQLTPGGVAGLVAQREGRRGGPLQPVVQVVDHQRFGQPGNGAPRHLLVLSDGVDQVVAMLTNSALGAIQGPNPLQVNSILQVLSWHCEEKKGRQVVFLIELQQLGLQQPGGTDAELQRFLSSQAATPPQQGGITGNPYAHPGHGSSNGGGHGDGHGTVAAAAMAPLGPSGGAPAVQPGRAAPPDCNPPEATVGRYEALPQGRNPYETGAGRHEAPPPGRNPYEPGTGWHECPQAAPGFEPFTRPAVGGGVATSGPPPCASGQAAGRVGQQSWPGPGGSGGGGMPQQQPMWQPAAAPVPAGPGHGGSQPHLPPTAGSRGPGHGHVAPTAAHGAWPPAPGQAPPPGGAAPDKLTPVKELTPYNPRWRIEARLTKKNTRRAFQYKSKEGEGQLFSIELVDRDGGEVRGTFFGDMCDRYYDYLQEGRMYSFGRGKLKKADPRWYTRGAHEITFDEGCYIDEIQDDRVCPKNIFDLKPISALKEVAIGSSVDLAAVVAAADGASDCPLRAGGTKPRHNVTLLDDSGSSIRLTLWGDQATDPRLVEGALAVLKGAKVSDFGGRSLCGNFSTQIYLAADAEAAHARATQLRQWFAAAGEEAKRCAESLSSASMGGGNSTPQSLAELQQEAVALELQAPGQPASSQTQKYHTVVGATITYFHTERPPFYRACPYQLPDDRNPGRTRSCYKKVDGGGGLPWTCALGHESERAVARWMATFSIGDHTGVQYVSGFDESLQTVFGFSAQEFADLWERRDTDTSAYGRIEETFRSRSFTKWRLRLKSKKELWNDEEKLKVSIMEAAKMDFAQVARSLLSEVRASLAAEARQQPARNGGA